MSEDIQSIDEILLQSDIYPHSDTQWNRSDVDNLKAAIQAREKAIVEAVIGKDRPYDTHPALKYNSGWHEGRRDLRTEQRTRYEEIRKGYTQR